jgi:hypothetical protein
MHTTVFNQIIDPREWRGVLNSKIIYNKSKLKFKRTDYDPMWYAHHAEIAEERISVDKVFDVPVGQVIEWETNQLHMGQSFKSCGATYKLHMTVISKE